MPHLSCIVVLIFQIAPLVQILSCAPLSLYPNDPSIYLHNCTAAATTGCQTPATTSQCYIIGPSPPLWRWCLHIHNLWLLQMCWIPSLRVMLICIICVLLAMLVRPICLRWQFMRLLGLGRLGIGWLESLSVLLIWLGLVGLVARGVIACIGGRRGLRNRSLVFREGVRFGHFELR